MKKIIGILLLSLCVTAGAAACGASEITLEESEISDRSTVLPAADAAADDTAAQDTVQADHESVEETAASELPAQNTVCVYVCGAVETPGVYALPEGARIYEAIALAGGLTADADTAVVNQAQVLSDGMMIRIPVIGENVTGEAVQSGDADLTAMSGTSGLVNINTANATQLMTLPGIGETKAAAILAYRERHGSFASKEELLNVSGIGDATYRNLEPRIAIQ